MARLIKAVARCGLRFESGLPRGAKERVSVYTCVDTRNRGSNRATEQPGESGREEEDTGGMENKRVEHIRWA